MPQSRARLRPHRRGRQSDRSSSSTRLPRHADRKGRRGSSRRPRVDMRRRRRAHDSSPPTRVAVLFTHQSPPLSEIGVRVHEGEPEPLRRDAAERDRASGRARAVPVSPSRSACRGRAVEAGRKVYEQMLRRWGVPSSELHRQRRIGPVALRLSSPPTCWSRCCGAWRATRGTRRSSRPRCRSWARTARWRGGCAARAPKGRVHAKTGSIANVRALSGYLTTADGERLVFSIIANNFKAPSAVIDGVADQASRTSGRVSERSRFRAIPRVRLLPQSSRASGARSPAPWRRCRGSGASRPPPCARSGLPPPLPPNCVTRRLSSAAASSATSPLRATTTSAGRSAVNEHRRRAGLARRSTRRAPSGRSRRSRPSPRRRRDAAPMRSALRGELACVIARQLLGEPAHLTPEIAALVLQRARSRRPARTAAPTTGATPPTPRRAARGTTASARHAADELEPRAALEALPARGPRSGQSRRCVRRGCRRRPTDRIRRCRRGAACRSRTGSLRSGSAAASSAVTKRIVTGRSSHTTRLAASSAAAISAGVTSRSRSIVDDRGIRGES